MKQKAGSRGGGLKNGGGGEVEPPSELCIGGFNLSEAKFPHVLNLFSRKK